LNFPGLRRKRELGFALLILLAAGMMFYLGYIARQEKATLAGKPEFEPTMGDLYSPWRGAQELILRHRDPYSAEVTGDIQSVYYGMVLTGAPAEPKDQQRFAYPVYVALYLLPFIHLPFSSVRVIFWWLLLAVTALSVPLWLRLTGRHPGTPATVALVAITLSSVPVVQGLNLQQLGLLVAFLLSGCAALLVGEHYFAAGALLGLATIKPQMTVLVTLWLLLWTVSDWRRRKPFFWGWISTVSALVLGGQLLSPGWIPRFIRGLFLYESYSGGRFWLTAMLPHGFAIAIGCAAAAGAVIAAWRARREPPGSPGFAFALVLLLNVTILIVPATKETFNQVLLLPGLALLLYSAPLIWRRSALSKAVSLFLGAVVISPWPLAAIVSLLWLFLPLGEPHTLWLAPIYLEVWLPLATLLGLALLSSDALRQTQ
jgi:Glycosyltransferase family 87